MPRNYQSKNAYNLPHNVYMQVIYIIKDYSRMLKERQNILYSGSFNDGQPKSINKSDPTADKALKLAMLSNRIDAIDKAIHDVNAFYSNKIKRDDINCLIVLMPLMITDIFVMFFTTQKRIKNRLILHGKGLEQNL